MLAVTIAPWLLSGAAGCSFLFSQGPPDNRPPRPAMPYFDCGESYVPPVIDTVVGAVSLLRVASLSNTELMANETRAERRVVTGVWVGVTALYASSAVYGYWASANCREAKAERAAVVNRERWLPPPYGQPPYGQPPPLWPPGTAPPPRPPSATPTPTPTPTAPQPYPPPTAPP